MLYNDFLENCWFLITIFLFENKKQKNKKEDKS
jgi:hypothetical protein